MLGTRGLTRLVVLLAFFWYYRGQVVLNTILIRSSFPRGYIANGNYTADCKTVRDLAVPQPESMSNCEDETFWELRDATGRTVQRPVLITCDAGRRAWNTVMGPLRDPKPLGSLWIYYAAPTPSGPTATTTRKKYLAPSLTPNTPHRVALVDYPAGHTFHPLGIAVWPSTAGNASHLYVVNHAEKHTVVEQFLLDPARPTEARHVRTIASRWFVSPNALALTAPDAFYVSNDHLLTRRLWLVGHVLPVMETVLGWPLGFVSHVTLTPPDASGASSTNAIASHFIAKYFVPFTNGVALSASGAHLAIVSSSLGQVWIYARDAATSRLTQPLAVVTVPFSPDNAHYTYNSKTGVDELIVAGHPNFPDLVKLGDGTPGAAAPSWVVTIVPKTVQGSKPEKVFDTEAPVSTNSKLAQDGATWTLKTLFQSDGNEEEGGFASSSTGLRDPETGTVYITGLLTSGGMLVCEPGAKRT
ncbi:hypothetical protein D9619_004847 [Psilocybe cf. subviscida]|uniref:Uncharacterized protein n=1 Tax=Psilocybe cf. subviscida TaxID=2480587 RepID=A0A8H5BSG9_9AGAR|nr:hypothetical protein D9619_004847 [Psilocybe cf. subviscida]